MAPDAFTKGWRRKNWSHRRGGGGNTRIQLSPEGVIGRKVTALRSGAERDSGAEACEAWEQELSNAGLVQHPGGTADTTPSPVAVTRRPAGPDANAARFPPASAAAQQPQAIGPRAAAPARAVTHLPAHNARRRHVSPRVPADDVAEPHVSPGLTTTSARSKRTSGREGGGDWRELRLVEGEGGAGEASGRMRGEDATRVAGGAELRMSLFSPFYFCLFFFLS